MKIVAYIRVSTEDQNLGPEVQAKAIRDWCTREGSELVRSFVDHGVSGASPLEKRPGLAGAIQALKDHDADALLVMKWDRLARDATLSGLLQREVERCGARILSTDGVGNEDTPEGALIRGIFSQFSEYERALIRTRTKAALAAKKARGERVGTIPYGWGLGDDGRSLEPLEAEQVVLEMIRLWRQVEGLSLRQIVRRLNARDIPARPRLMRGRPAGEGPPGRWHYPMVQRICKRLEAA